MLKFVYLYHLLLFILNCNKLIFQESKRVRNAIGFGNVVRYVNMATVYNFVLFIEASIYLCILSEYAALIEVLL